MDPRFGWNIIKCDSSWDADPDDLQEFRSLSVEEGVRKVASEIKYEDSYAKYDDRKYVRKYGTWILADPRALWKAKFIDCYKLYKNKYFPTLQDDFVLQHRAAKSLFVSEIKTESDDLDIRPGHRDKGVDENGIPRSDIPGEVARFFALSEDHPIELDVLAWWKTNQHRYPVIARIARDVLAMQPSSIETERVHSGARTLLDWNQARMGVSTIEAALKVKCFAKYNNRAASEDSEERPLSFEHEYSSLFCDEPEVVDIV